MKKPIIFVLVFFLIIFVLKFVFPEYEVFTSLEKITIYHHDWLLFYQAQPFKVILFFFLFNTTMAALPIPGVSMVSLLGGALFGFFPGLMYTSIATAVGNLLGFFIARYFLQEWVEKRYGQKVRMFKNEWQREGALALFSFRIFPFIPSFVANLIMGVSKLHWWTFFWVSWLGRTPMVLVYTWAGVQFANIEGLDDILSPKVASAFILLAIMPWVFRHLKQRYYE